MISRIFVQSAYQHTLASIVRQIVQLYILCNIMFNDYSLGRETMLHQYDVISPFGLYGYTSKFLATFY